VTVAQYAQFLNAVATQSDPYGLYDPYMGHGQDRTAPSIQRLGSPGAYSYVITQGGYTVNNANFPMNIVTWATPPGSLTG